VGMKSWPVVASTGLIIAVMGCGKPSSTPVSKSGSPKAESLVAARDAASRIVFRKNFAAAVKQAEQSGKPLLLFFHATWSASAKAMLRDTLRDPTIVRLSRRFVCVAVDADRDGSVCDQYAIVGFPSIQFVSPDGVPLNRLVGHRTADELAAQMHAALEAAAERTAATSKHLY